jgi:N-acetylglucosamine malate deacetylase 2
MSTILAIAAHPDDETMLAGGTLAMYAEQGHAVYILVTTRGEGGEAGDPPLAELEQLGAYREREVREAAAALGARDVLFLPFVDPRMEIGGAPNRVDVPLEEFVAVIAAHLRQIRPDIVLTHGTDGEYGHPQHIQTNRATRLALASLERRPALLTWNAWYDGAERPRMLNRADRADIVRDVTPWLPAKIAAAMAHRTQHTMFLRNTGAPAVGDMVSRIESFRSL